MSDFFTKRSRAATVMHTHMELWFQAKQCLELARGTNEYYAKVALRELARKFKRHARRAERRQHKSEARSR
jgi:hypothetical protein